ncbi:MBL fold metallo-hydrolase [Streptomyces sp. NPDC053542]|uniref:MBL fold metallo-hydrolase n=1 Tax=Streptomyces sp. NPDC053542 TaxID=3365710 RepID=UPI0037CDF874
MSTAAPPRGVGAGRLTAVCDDVYSYVQPDGSWCLNNAGLVVGGDTAVLVDTVATRPRAERLRAEVAKVVPGGPGLVVNTHFHGDHHFGNSLFTPRATVVAHELARTEILRAGLGLTQLWPDVDWGDIELAPPTLTFRDSLRLHLGDLTAELRHPGPAHTTNDTIVWIPERQVLFSGDIVMAGVTPFCLMGSVEGSVRTVRELRSLGATTIVPGHGPVSGPSVLDDTEEYLLWIQRIAREGYEAGRTALETARRADLGAFARWLDPERVVGNVHRAYAELAGGSEGADLDILVPFQEMAAYHGGMPTCHA